MRRRARGRPFAPAGLIAREFIHTLPYTGSEEGSLALLSLPEFAGHAGSTPSSGCRTDAHWLSRRTRKLLKSLRLISFAWR
jgi:hypothetical protein